MRNESKGDRTAVEVTRWFMLRFTLEDINQVDLSNCL